MIGAQNRNRADAGKAFCSQVIGGCGIILHHAAHRYKIPARRQRNAAVSRNENRVGHLRIAVAERVLHPKTRRVLLHGRDHTCCLYEHVDIG